METNNIYAGDCLKILPTFPENSIDSVVTDPPYGLKFMSKAWDHGVPGVPFWAEVLRVMKPGGTLLAFGGTRTFHRLACAIEDAGFEIRDCLSWLYGSGFPKSLDLSKAIDKSEGAKRETAIKRTLNNNRFAVSGTGRTQEQYRKFEGNADITIPSTELAKKWSGWGTALKPAWESILVMQKPLDLNGLCGTLAHKIKEALCRLPSFVRDAGESFKSSRRDSVGDVGSALWRAVERCNTLADLSALTGTLQSESAIPSSLSTALSWLGLLAALCEQKKMFTTETETVLTTDLRILNSTPSALTPESIIEAATFQLGTASSVSLAATTFSAVAGRLALTLEHSALGPATSRGSEWALRPNWIPILLAMKPLDGTFVDNAKKHGVAGLNIDGARIEANSRPYRKQLPSKNRTTKTFGQSAGLSGMNLGMTDKGRWPANVMLDEDMIPILRLTNTCERGIIQAIEGYFHDYTLPNMPKIIQDVSKPDQEREGEVLRSSLLCEVAQSKSEGEETPILRKEAFDEIDPPNEEGQEGESEKRSGKSCMEGGKIQFEGISHDSSRFPSEERAEGICSDGDEIQWALRSGASPDHGSVDREGSSKKRNSSSQERDQERQSKKQSRASRQLRSQEETLGAPERSEEASERKGKATRKALEVLEDDIPEKWRKYFEKTGKMIRIGSAEMLDEQSGELKGGKLEPWHAPERKKSGAVYGAYSGLRVPPPPFGGDSGGASRFFYVAKASRSEREAGLEEIAESSSAKVTRRKPGSAGLNNPRAGMRRMGAVRNTHPTVKPVKLMEYLVRLTSTPTGGIVLDPFAGSGTTALACIRVGRPWILIEKEERYCEIAKRRIAALTGQKKLW